MLPSSNFTIIFKESEDYWRSTVLIHIVAAIIVCRSSLPLFIIVTSLLILIFFSLNIYFSKMPSPCYEKICYHPGYWLLYEYCGNHIKYERVVISFDGGLFIILKLSGISPLKNLVIFSDQITEDQYRMLKISAYSKINKY